MNVKIRRIPLDTKHMNQKCLVLEGSIEGCPEVTKTRNINTMALASGGLSLESEKAKLIADVEEYYVRWMAVQEALKNL